MVKIREAGAAIPQELPNYDLESGQVIWWRRDSDDPVPPAMQANATSTKHLVGDFARLA
jgi:hypothetical protein